MVSKEINHISMDGHFIRVLFDYDSTSLNFILYRKYCKFFGNVCLPFYLLNILFFTFDQPNILKKLKVPESPMDHPCITHKNVLIIKPIKFKMFLTYASPMHHPCITHASPLSVFLRTLSLHLSLVQLLFIYY